MRALLPVALLLTLFLAGCTGNVPTSTVNTQPLDQGNAPATGSTSTSPVSQDHAVAVASFSYTPKEITIAVGDKVTWTNTATARHTASSYSSNNGWDSGSLAPQGTFSHTFTVPGNYTYHCKIHSTMSGLVIVQ